jgi:hypothetical protein
MQTIYIFQKLFVFSQFHNHANDVYVKIYETAQLSVLCFFFLNKKQNIHVNFAKCIMGCIFNSVGLIITLEISCIQSGYENWIHFPHLPKRWNYKKYEMELLATVFFFYITMLSKNVAKSWL